MKERVDFLKTFQENQAQRFLARGFPTRREEAFKYTDLSFLAKETFDDPSVEADVVDQALLAARAKEATLVVLINGHYVKALSTVGELPKGVIIEGLSASFEKHAGLLKPYLGHEKNVKQYPLSVLNDAHYSDGLFIYVPAGFRFEKPVHLLSLSLGPQAFVTHPRTILVLEEKAYLSLSEEYRGEGEQAYLTNAVADCWLGEGAELAYYHLQQEAAEARHFKTTFVRQAKKSILNACSFSMGAKIARHDFNISLDGEQAFSSVKGFYGLTREGQVLDQHVYVDHQAAHTHSVMDFRGILTTQARAVFNGKVRVQKTAKHTKAEQVNHNLLLSPLAEVNTKPELEIYTDEVACHHGATVGQLDEDLLFYLATRGLDRQTAVFMLLQGVTAALLSEVKEQGVATLFQAEWEACLARGAAL